MTDEKQMTDVKLPEQSERMQETFRTFFAEIERDVVPLIVKDVTERQRNAERIRSWFLS